MTVTVWDSDWDPETYEDVVDARVLELGHLLLVGKDDKPRVVFAPGAWAKFEVDVES